MREAFEKAFFDSFYLYEYIKGRRRWKFFFNDASFLTDRYDDDDDELLDSGVDSEFVAADENDDSDVKAAAGAALEAPEVDYDGPTIDVPQGKFVMLCMFR